MTAIPAIAAVIPKIKAPMPAVLAINASNYTWNEVGQYAILYGATKYHGNVIRKSVETKDLVGFDQDGNFSIGSPVESVYNAVEGSPTLVKDGEVYHANLI